VPIDRRYLDPVDLDGSIAITIDNLHYGMIVLSQLKIISISEMIAAKENFPRFTPEEYFAWEEQQNCRHEYIDGEVYAMTGGTINHSKIASNVNFLLKSHLRGGGCQVLTSDARVNIVRSTDYVYPDISVTCDERDKTTSQFITHPCLIVEVLSSSTEAYDSPLETLRDRGNKFRMYRRNPNLRDYVLVDANEIAVEIYHQDEDNKWDILNYRSGDLVEMKSINLTVNIEQVYEDIVLVQE
jgi:Uma2 family endonuclease